MVEWIKCSEKMPEPDMEKYLLISFKSHFGIAISIGSFEEATDEWYVVSEEDGTMDKAIIEPEYWADFNMPITPK